MKVRVSYTLAALFDALVVAGDVTSTGYPRVPGRFAIGIVTEVGEGCESVKKDDRVYLRSVRGCRKCLDCLSGHEDECKRPVLAGKDFDGFYRDFLVCDEQDVTVLPEELDNLQALCIEHVALAENIYQKLNLSAGSIVAVIGAGFLGNIVAQVLQYHKLVPVVIDNNETNLSKVRHAGAAYAFPVDDELMENIRSVTTGNLCSAAIFLFSSKLPTMVATTLLAPNSPLVLAGSEALRTTIDTHTLLEKNLYVYGVNNGYGQTDKAIAMLVDGALDVGVFNKTVVTDFNELPEELNAVRTATPDKSTDMHVFKLIL